MRPPRRSALFRVPLTLTMLFVLLLPGTALADPPTVRTSDEAYLLQDDGLVLASGPPLEEGCTKEGFVEWEQHVVANRNGEVARGSYEDEFFVFDLEANGVSSFFELLDTYCPSIAEGGPGPEIFATGSGTVSAVIRCRYGDDGCDSPGSVTRYHVRMRGVVTDGDGVEYDARGLGRWTVTVTEDGAEVEERDRVRLRPLS